MKFTFQPEAKPLDGYTIKRAINRGGFGEVYFALTDSGKEVALKLIHDHSEVELRGVSQCLNIKHPNLIMIFDIRKDRDEDCWVVMEFVHGKTLSEILAKNQQGLPMEDVLRWVEGISQGIGFLHEHGIVHRDLKPANVFMEHNHVKIGDIGLSKFITPSKRSAQTQSVGTVYYMAPEVAHGRYDKEVDVYALGVMTYELLTGKLPFDGQSSGEIMMKHLTALPDMSPIPEAMRPSILKALEKDPAKRYRDIREFHKDFRQAVLGRKREDSIYTRDQQKPSMDTSPYPVHSREHEPTIHVDDLQFTESNNGNQASVKLPWWQLLLGEHRHQHFSRIAITLGVIFTLFYLTRNVGMSSAPSFRLQFATSWFLLFTLGIAFSLIYYGFIYKKPKTRPNADPVNQFSPSLREEKKLPPKKNYRELWEQQWWSLTLHSNFVLTLCSLVIVWGMYLIVPKMFGLEQADWNFTTPVVVSFLAVTCLAGWGLNIINACQLRYRSWGKYDDWLYPAWGVVVAKSAESISDLLMIQNPLGNEMWGSSAIINFIGPFALTQGNQPTALAYVLYFSCLFYVVGWLKMTIPYRQKKVSLGKLIEAGIWGYILALLFYNNTAAVFFPVTLALTLQLSSTWFDQEQHTPGGHL